MNDFSRQHEIFDVEKFNTPINIVGCGATGSWVALMLAKMGISNITCWDFDKVEEHNLPNQFFDMLSIGYNKAEELAILCNKFSSISIKKNVERVTGKQRLEGVVFMLTDTMSSRKEIFDMAIKLKPQIDLLIETRMDLCGGRIYTLNPYDFTHIKKYEETFYTDEDSAVSACGTSQSIISTAINIASLAVWQMINWHNQISYANEILVDCENNNMFAQRWE